jgi:hypothetical protein
MLDGREESLALEYLYSIKGNVGEEEGQGDTGPLMSCKAKY